MSARIQEVEKRLAKAKSSALARAVPPSFPPPAPQPVAHLPYWTPEKLQEIRKK
jgi:hypothetical protein